MVDRRHRAERELDERDYPDYADFVAHASGGRHRERRADYHRVVGEAHERRERESEFQRRNLSPVREEPPFHRYCPEDYATREPIMQHRRPEFEGFEERVLPRRGGFDGFGVEERLQHHHRQFEGREEGMGRYRDQYGGYGQAPAYDRFERGGYGEVQAYDPFEGDRFQQSPARYGESRRNGEAYDAGLDRGFRHREGKCSFDGIGERHAYLSCRAQASFTSSVLSSLVETSMTAGENCQHHSQGHHRRLNDFDKDFTSHVSSVARVKVVQSTS